MVNTRLQQQTNKRQRANDARDSFMEVMLHDILEWCGEGCHYPVACVCRNWRDLYGGALQYCRTTYFSSSLQTPEYFEKCWQQIRSGLANAPFKDFERFCQLVGSSKLCLHVVAFFQNNGCDWSAQGVLPEAWQTNIVKNQSEIASGAALVGDLERLQALRNILKISESGPVVMSAAKGGHIDCLEFVLSTFQHIDDEDTKKLITRMLIMARPAQPVWDWWMAREPGCLNSITVGDQLVNTAHDVSVRFANHVVLKILHGDLSSLRFEDMVTVIEMGCLFDDVEMLLSLPAISFSDAPESDWEDHLALFVLAAAKSMGHKVFDALFKRGVCYISAWFSKIALHSAGRIGNVAVLRSLMDVRRDVKADLWYTVDGNIKVWPLQTLRFAVQHWGWGDWSFQRNLCKKVKEQCSITYNWIHRHGCPCACRTQHTKFIK